MPELPEVETVRAGLERWVAGRRIRSVTVRDDRSLRRHAEGPGDFVRTLAGRTVVSVERRGKYLWFPLEGTGQVLVAHLGMSGQLLVKESDAPGEKHLKVTVDLEEDSARPAQLRFVDQRIFGGLFLSPLVPGQAGRVVPAAVAHIAPDPLEETFVPPARPARALKRLLLDQAWVSGVGNIYADEALWRAGLHHSRLAADLDEDEYARLWTAVREVLTEAVAAGGTSFDDLYVNVNGSSGYFSRSLNAYGQAGKPCHRCATTMKREVFAGRSSHFCPGCQVERPRKVSRAGAGPASPARGQGA